MQEQIELSWALLWALASLAFATSITPGPNNLMLMSSGMRFGIKRSLPHAAGVALGFGLLLAACDLGLGELALRHPLAARLLTAGCAVYLLNMGLQLLSASPPTASATPDVQQPMSLLGAIAFQWANPKGWSMAIAGAALMAQSELPASLRVTLLVLVYSAVNLPSILLWTALGAQLRRRLTQPRFHLMFRVLMALLLAATAAWMMHSLHIPWPAPVLHSDNPAIAIGR